MSRKRDETKQRHDLEIRGARLWRSYLDPEAQAEMLREVEGIVAAAPFVRPVTPWGRPMSVEMTSAGRYGWVTDRRGYSPSTISQMVL
jgi:alkylated DNA repair protein (DNA oxidative demethylase)